jgi:hypothetical protein
MKSDGRLERNFLVGPRGDAVSPCRLCGAELRLDPERLVAHTLAGNNQLSTLSWTPKLISSGACMAAESNAVQVTMGS